MKEIEDERAQIAGELKKALGPGGRKRRLGTTPERKVWGSLTKNIRRLFPRLQNAGLPNLATHLKNTLLICSPHITYQPSPKSLVWRTAG
jgi:hypothetical protein